MKKRGFTLVELLVVIGIIAVLISILLPSLNRARKSAKAIACASNLKQIGNAVAMYQSENKGCLPFAMVYYNSWNQVTWDDLLNKYWGGKAPQDDSWPSGVYGSTTLIDIRVLRCADDDYRGRRPVGAWNYAVGKRDALRSYSMVSAVWNDNGNDNYAGSGAYAWTVTGTYPSARPSNPNFRYFKPKDFDDASNTILLTEHFDANVAGHSSGAMVNRPIDLWPRETTTLKNLPHNGGRRNNLFVDGHVQAMTIPEMCVNPGNYGPSIGGAWVRKR
jgi:prepilin-type N-terminal cleavage/methylation domain-containing protein/prepilin-type processing-associated H-X9-DG protein